MVRSMAKILMIRHGETNYNKEGRYCGSTDIELNEIGIEQAIKVSEQLLNHSIDVIISSPLKRAVKTSNIISDKLGIPIVVVEGLEERNVGVYEGLTRKEVEERYPELWNNKSLGLFSEAPHGGESIEAVQNRVFRALDMIMENYKDKNILIVCHGFVTRVINKYFNEVPEEDFHKFVLKNCEIFEFDC